MLNPKALYDIEIKDPSRAISIFMPYDLEITVPGGIVIDLGRFSLSVLPKIHILTQGSEGAHVRIGAFCQAAGHSTVMVGGNHSNDSLLNYSFGQYAEYFRHFMGPDDEMAGMVPATAPVIGDNVTISRGAIVLDDARIGAGCVIGAGAVVARQCEPLGVYGGVPAKLIRRRFDDRMAELYERVDLPSICAHSLPTLASKIVRLEAGDIGIEEFRASVEYLKVRPKVHMFAKIKNNVVDIEGFNGFSIDGKPVTDAGKIEQLQRYFAQPATNPNALKWSPDIFYALGLYPAT